MRMLDALPGTAPGSIHILGATLANSMRIVEDLAFRDVECRLADRQPPPP